MVKVEEAAEFKREWRVELEKKMDGTTSQVMEDFKKFNEYDDEMTQVFKSSCRSYQDKCMEMA